MDNVNKAGAGIGRATSAAEEVFAQRIALAHRRLGIPAGYAERSGLPLQPEPETLVETENDYYGRQQYLTPSAFGGWRAMKEAAAAEGVTTFLISAWRGVDYQCGLIEKKLRAGQAIEAILQVNAAPGYSEHHSGRALDLGTKGCRALEEEFEQTEAFAWLAERAADFGFFLSYPRDNPSGISYEPWHWCYADPDMA